MHLKYYHILIIFGFVVAVIGTSLYVIGMAYQESNCLEKGNGIYFRIVGLVFLGSGILLMVIGVIVLLKNKCSKSSHVLLTPVDQNNYPTNIHLIQETAFAQCHCQQLNPTVQQQEGCVPQQHQGGYLPQHQQSYSAPQQGGYHPLQPVPNNILEQDYTESVAPPPSYNEVTAASAPPLWNLTP